MSAHDVRFMRVCAKCGHLGDKRHMLELPLLDDDGDGYWWHGGCFIQVKGIDALLSMPRDQLDCLTLGDIGKEAMKRLLRKPLRASRSRPSPVVNKPRGMA